jgi:N-carbamoyl-L-amino-acid hydrolase
MPAAMLFIPSVGGVSHSFAEDSRAEDIVLGCEVAAEVVARLLLR